MTFRSDLVDQLRAGDTYGRLDRVSEDKLLKPFILTREDQRQIPVACDVDPHTESRLRSFYQAVAVGIEKSAGPMTTTVLDLSHEGFGRVIIFAAKLVVMSEVLRDAQRFGSGSVEALTERGERLVEAGAKIVADYPEVARDDD